MLEEALLHYNEELAQPKTVINSNAEIKELIASFLAK